MRALSCVGFLFAACAAPRPDVDPERSIASALETPRDVVFEDEAAAGEPSPARLELALAVRRAVARSPELRAALARVRAARADADQARMLPNPILRFVFRFPEGGGSAGVEASLTSEWLAILERPRRAQAADSRLEAEAARALAAALDVVAGVQARYLEVQSSELIAASMERRLELLGRAREIARARVEAGEGARAELSSIEAERAEASVELAAERLRARLARLGLARAIGEPEAAARWELDPWQRPAPAAGDESHWIESALSARPELLAIEWELRARGVDASLAQRSIFEGSAVGVAAERDGTWSGGPELAVPLPLFDTGRAREQRAQALTDEERQRLESARRAAIEDVRAALASFSATLENLARIESELVPLQAARRAEVQAAFELGFADASALLIAEQAVGETDIRRVEAERDVLLAEQRLQRAVGGPARFRTTSTSAPGAPQS